MTRWNPNVILTDGNGRPFERPIPPGSEAPADKRVAYIRALHAYNDAVTDCANKAFDETLRKKLR